MAAHREPARLGGPRPGAAHVRAGSTNCTRPSNVDDLRAPGNRLDPHGHRPAAAAGVSRSPANARAPERRAALVDSRAESAWIDPLWVSRVHQPRIGASDCHHRLRGRTGGIDFPPRAVSRRLRDNTERPVTISHGTNRLIGSRPVDLARTTFETLARHDPPKPAPPLWDGHCVGQFRGMSARLEPKPELGDQSRPEPTKPGRLEPLSLEPPESLLIAALAWGAFAFGAVYPWVYWPLVAACWSRRIRRPVRWNAGPAPAARSSSRWRSAPPPASPSSCRCRWPCCGGLPLDARRRRAARTRLRHRRRRRRHRRRLHPPLTWTGLALPRLLLPPPARMLTALLARGDVQGCQGAHGPRRRAGARRHRSAPLYKERSTASGRPRWRQPVRPVREQEPLRGMDADGAAAGARPPVRRHRARHARREADWRERSPVVFVARSERLLLLPPRPRHGARAAS